jgi:GNAT superfamily N-acetyltransferase
MVMAGSVISIMPASAPALVAAQWLESEWPGIPIVRWLVAPPSTTDQREGLPSALGVEDDDHRLCGFGALLMDDMPDRSQWNPWLGCVFVEPSQRRRGIARCITAALVAEGRSRGFAGLYLFCAPQLVEFYASFGFEEIEERKFEGSAQVTMRKDLS